jgi:hypothetical protein
MSRGPTKMKLRAYHCEFQKNGTDRFTMELHGETKGDRTVIVQFDCSWDCVSYVLGNLSTKWNETRAIRLNKIAQLDHVLPQAGE